MNPVENMILSIDSKFYYPYISKLPETVSLGTKLVYTCDKGRFFVPSDPKSHTFTTTCVDVGDSFELEGFMIPLPQCVFNVTCDKKPHLDISMNYDFIFGATYINDDNVR